MRVLPNVAVSGNRDGRNTRQCSQELFSMDRQIVFANEMTKQLNHCQVGSCIVLVHPTGPVKGGPSR
jgi:hypothetical protein